VPLPKSTSARPERPASAGRNANKEKLRIDHQPKNSMSRLQIEVAARMKTVNRYTGDQKYRAGLALGVLSIPSIVEAIAVTCKRRIPPHGCLSGQEPALRGR
jgi:hypothetical protein